MFVKPSGYFTRTVPNSLRGFTQRTSAVPDDSDPILLLVAGQSNATKLGTDGIPPAKYDTLTDAYMWIHGSTAFAAYDCATNSDHRGEAGSNWGSEAEFIYQTNLAYPGRKVYVIKEAVGGTSLASAANSDWAPTNTGERFSGLEDQTTAARAWLVSNAVTIASEAMLWNQGEGDANDPTEAAAYKANFDAFMVAFRSRVSATAKIIVERIRPYSGDLSVSTYSNVFAIRKAQIDSCVVDGNATAIDIDFEPAHFATLHPPNSWCEGCGLRAYAAYAGSYDGTYGSILDDTPSNISFTDSTEQPTSTVTLSNSITPVGFERDAAVTISGSGAEYQVYNPDDTVYTAWTTSAGRIHKWQKIRLRMTSSAIASTASDCTINVGSASDVWTVTTAASVIDYEAEVDAFIARIATNGGASMSGPQSVAVNDFVLALKAASLFTTAKIARLYLGAVNGPIAAKIDLMDQTTSMVQGTIINGGSWSDVTWTAYVGWDPANIANRGLNMYVDPSTATTQNSAGIFAYMAETTVDAEMDFSESVGTFGFRVQSTALRSWLHNTTNQNLTGLTNVAGFYAVMRTASNVTKFYGVAGTQVGSNNTTASITPTAVSLWLGSPTATATADRAISIHGVTTGLNDAEVLALRNACVAFLAAFTA
jgi:hypothetical protein